jgi:hypothetical protein
MLYSPGLALHLLYLSYLRCKGGEKVNMVQNLALIVWPLLMVLLAIVPVLLGLRAYLRDQ